MTLEAQTQFNALADRLSAAKAAQKAALATLGRTPTDVWDTYPDELRAVTGGTGNYQESKTVTADPAGMTILPDEGYSGMLKAIIAAEPNFQPWNLVDGIEAWGITGTAKPAVSTAPPTNLPVDKDDADTAYEDATGAAPTEADYFILADNDGNITYGYMQSASTALYNGVELPDIESVWTDKETYPYACIFDQNSNLYKTELFLALTSEPIYSDGTNFICPGKSIRYFIDVDSADVTYHVWGHSFISNSDYSLFSDDMPQRFYWSNYDLYLDGSVYLAASDPVPSGGFTITYYDPSTTEFKATGWTRLSYHTTGENAGQWTFDDFTSEASAGENYLKNIRYCTREKLYWQGYEVWPVPFRNATWETLFDGTVKTGYLAQYLHIANLASPSPTLGYVFAEGDFVRVTVNGVNSIFVAGMDDDGKSFYAGNPDLYNKANQSAFSGYPYLTKTSISASQTNYLFQFVARDSGTYKVTIEKAVR